MEALYVLVPLSVLAMLGAAWVFLRMSDTGQFDDLDGPGWSVLHDDDRPRPAREEGSQLDATQQRGDAAAGKSAPL
jgi:cbb3-type cytochrome oxidase maturation protein